MKIVIQRVKKAEVTRVDTNVVTGSIKNGLFLLVGFKKGDTKEQILQSVNKIIKLRVMSDQKDKMNLSIMDTDSEVLIVSQFTLYANTKDGNRPSFIDAEEPQKAKELYEYLISQFKEKNIKVETGSFGDYMKIDCELDGPVTIVLEN